ncbi:hypothetical protein [Natrialbaceae archaeon AArc-T1-2]|uniref:hypothetical protein n=1 Tax=Natrialbaceae archaeon AArc-T1-2 TaxID=3053904 RepID=UPI00255B235A|nr:hypothetical protein [Natrialbaceae archaeon AArc-T1-2]WIV68045.1 hypothetical protein QQ977_04755 [Natrialbaceae archaeon AArc-T1-2]
MSGDDDPGVIRSLAISAADVVDAFVYTRENPGTSVLRVTPPFHGRMRARIHVSHGTDRATDAIHVSPADLLADAVVSEFPTLAAIEGDLPDEASPERVREARADALEAWRDRATDAIVDETTIETDCGTTRVSVARLD